MEESVINIATHDKYKSLDIKGIIGYMKGSFNEILSVLQETVTENYKIVYHVKDFRDEFPTSI